MKHTRTGRPRPPRLAVALLRRYCAPAWAEEIEGDLLEQFDAHVRAHGRFVAALLYWAELLQFARPYVLRRDPDDFPRARGPVMLKSFFALAVRALRRHPSHAAINVAGLGVGMACCLLLLLFVRDELSYDRFHPGAGRIYRIVSDWGDFTAPVTNVPLVRALRAEHPGLPIALLKPHRGMARYEDRMFQEALLFAHPDAFQVFAIPLLHGHAHTVLAQPYTAVITEALARKYFGTADPVGKRLLIDYQMEVEVTGVTPGMPAQSHFHFDLLVSWSTLDALNGYRETSDWGDNSLYAYLRLPEGYAPSTFERQLPGVIERHAGVHWNGSKLSLQALTDIHLRSHLDRELEANGDITYVYVFSVVGLFVLLVACINFVNLSTARSADRAKEVGVRKVMGATRGQLAAQLLGESVVLAAVALVLAAGLVGAALPGFRALSGKPLPLEGLYDGPTLLAALVLTLFVGVLGGGYPALVLSAFRPVAVLKGAFRTSPRGVWLRKGLVVFQFTTSVALIAGTLVVYRQLDYLRRTSLGFDQEQVLVVPFDDGAFLKQYPAFKSTLLQQANVQAVSITSERFPSELLDGMPTVLGSTPVEAFRQGTFVPTRTVSVGHDFFEALGVNVIHGRTFSRDFPSDSGAFILNETAARMLQQTFPAQVSSLEAAVGLELAHLFDRGQLIGIVEDFNMATLHEAIEPILFRIEPEAYDAFVIRVAPGDHAGTVEAARGVWERLYPGWPFRFNFADQAFDAQYQREERLGEVFTVFALLAVVIAALGLMGLAAHTTAQRRKEIGVRKVLGASVAGIVLLLAREFMRLVAIALVLAVPLVYVAMDRWLGTFAYRTRIAWWIFAVAGAAALLVALLAVGHQSIRAARTDPVKSLRYE